MDFYQNNPNRLRRLLTKRQNPYTQIFKAQPSNPTNVPMTTINLARNDISATQEDKNTQSPIHNTPLNNLPQNNFHSFHQTIQEPEISQTQSNDQTSLSSEEDDEDDAAPIEVIQKKVKTIMLTTANDLKSRRGSDFEEEKEQSEHSTSCETRSEFNIIHESGDFLTSPHMNHQYLRDPSELKLDNDNDNISRNGSVSTNPSEENGKNNKKIQEIINQIGENLAACNFEPGSKQKIRCKIGHQWEIELSNVAKGCPRCCDLLNECREFARKNEGSCLNKEYEETIHYRCNKGHCWKLNYKNARRRWCAQCAKEQRAFLKKKCEEEKVEREKKEEESQKKLFEEARKKAMQDNQTTGSQPFGFTQSKTEAGTQKSMSMMEYFQRIDFETESLAKKYTIQFMSQKDFSGDISYQQILQVYKILIMPEQVLQTYMFNLNGDALRAEFRRMAKIIHPDKNKHPQAGNAFQKVYKVYEVALSRQEGNQQKI
jgi:hypothetical protein